ncbi:MAG: Major facilitator superfamily MFS_1 [Candidatus Tokpelaia hoelldobleri]|uniref:Major facilitator superfamily MFS_1 n=1 Tax=Candidatus Tokpelaia hoelldobleri TaxID=1902579 RepID=A0A1U9JV15_9HYPH|nr:MAG: Major facilitator superfamily MFS_1 [Candidatus Tokpelaia hoelldoblerii]
MNTRVLKKKDNVKLVMAASIGNFLEVFDFVVYAFFAKLIGELFFSSSNPLLSSVIVFGVGFVMRPLGSLYLGSYADRHGRKASMLLSIMLMALGSACIAFAPTYQGMESMFSLGIIAPCFIIIGRLLQGFSTGGEIGAATTLLMESASPRSRGFYVSWQFTTQAFAAIAGSALGALLFWGLSDEQMYAWGWRIPFMLSLFIIPVGLYIRKNLDETYVEAERHAKTAQAPIVEILRDHGLQFIASIGMIIPGTMLTFTVTSFMPTFLQEVTTLPPEVTYLISMASNVIVAVANILGGLFYDRLPVRKYAIIGLHLVSIALAGFMFVSTGNIMLFFSLLLLCSFVMGLAQPMKTTLVVEAFPVHVRATAMAVTYSLGVAIFGGTSQPVAVKLMEITGGNPVAPLYYLIPMTLIGVASYLLFKEKRA